MLTCKIWITFCWWKICFVQRIYLALQIFYARNGVDVHFSGRIRDGNCRKCKQSLIDMLQRWYDLIAIFSGINESWRFGAQKDLRWSGLRYCCPLQWKQSLYKIQFSCLYTTSTPFQSVFIQLRCGLFFFIFSRNFEVNLQTALYFECSKI